MPEVADGNTIEVGEAGGPHWLENRGLRPNPAGVDRRDLRPQQAEVPRQRLRYNCRRGNSAAGTRPVARAPPSSKLRVFAGRSGRSASRGAAAKATYASRSYQPLQMIEEATYLYSRPRLCAIVNFASLRR